MRNRLRLCRVALFRACSVVRARRLTVLTVREYWAHEIMLGQAVLHRRLFERPADSFGESAWRYRGHDAETRAASLSQARGFWLQGKGVAGDLKAEGYLGRCYLKGRPMMPPISPERGRLQR